MKNQQHFSRAVVSKYHRVLFPRIVFEQVFAEQQETSIIYTAEPTNNNTLYDNCL